MDAVRQLFFDAVARSCRRIRRTRLGGGGRDARHAGGSRSTRSSMASCSAARAGCGWASSAIVVLLLAFDLGVLHRNSREIEVGESLVLSAAYIGVALLFGFWVWCSLGDEAGMAYLTGLPGREEPGHGQRVRDRHDPGLLRDPAAVPPPRPVLGHPRRHRPARDHDRAGCGADHRVPAGSSTCSAPSWSRPASRCCWSRTRSTASTTTRCCASCAAACA